MDEIKATFEKKRLEVGLSADLPLQYDGPGEKYTLADLLAQLGTPFFKLEKESLFVDFQGTTTEFMTLTGHSPARLRCHALLNEIPEEGLEEVEEELCNARDHYIELSSAVKAAPQLPAPAIVNAIVEGREKR